ncbi:MAG: fluoride efflux transporter CrcB [Deltaproteobacteria bacterium]|nr:MAG: fluoride efflux transporter CrcB [Deltaproteobacteria bacterium]
MRNLLFISLAGAFGAGSRYLVSGWAYRVLGDRLPFGTMTVNLLGCLAAGALLEVGLNSDAIPPSLRNALAIGFLGAFTTFSTFEYETFRMLEDGRVLAALSNVGIQLVAGLAAVGGGIALGRLVVGGS